jgi:hypothetical protein
MLLLFLHLHLTLIRLPLLFLLQLLPMQSVINVTSSTLALPLLLQKHSVHSQMPPWLLVLPGTAGTAKEQDVL